MSDYDYEDEDRLPAWEESAKQFLSAAMEDLEFDPVKNEVGIVIPVRYKRDPTSWFSSAVAIRNALARQADEIAVSEAPFEGGAPVFEIDTTEWAAEALEGHGVWSDR